VEDCKFDSAYVFKFSPREGTEAANIGDVVSPEVAQKRFVEVLRAIEGNAFRRNREKIGAVEDVYVRHGANEDGRAIGETWSGHAVHLKTGAAPGEYVRCRVGSAGPHVLYADPIQ
jgi:tRNA-2-methylthio-N6-dimethylallyladenosine synthase